jgi:hypothetical protein
MPKRARGLRRVTAGNCGPGGRSRHFSRPLATLVLAAVNEFRLHRLGIEWLGQCHQAAKQFGVGISTAINWVKRLRETSSVAPGKMGGHKPRAILGQHRLWLLQQIKDGDFTLRGLVVETPRSVVLRSIIVRCGRTRREMPQLRDDLFRLVSLPCHCSPP